MTFIVRVWDLPTRLFHWALVACVLALFATAYAPGSWLPWHARAGYLMLALLLFRLVWGFIGGRWSRFSAFAYGPGSVLRYARGQGEPDQRVGHNPLGALSVLAILAVLLLQVGTGLIGDDETAFTGPLNRLVSSAQGLAATAYHKRIGQWLVVGLSGLHVVAVLYYRWKKKDDLIGPMVRGDKRLDRAAPASRDDAASRWTALALAAACAALVEALVRWTG